MKPSRDGLLVLDKPGGLTSRAALDRALRWFPRGTRMGHTGTLDPLATGVLVLCLGAATRLAEYVQRMGKTYRTTLRLGARSDTDDADGTITPVAVAVPPDTAAVRAALPEFTGTIEQVPPAYSAAKVTGQRAYDLARQGREVELQARRIDVHGLDLLRYEYPYLDLEVRCGKGTYIRSLARDLGARLGCGALVQTLRRTRVGPFTAEEAVALETEAQAARSRVLPVGLAVVELPRVVLQAAAVERLRRGQTAPLGARNLPRGAGSDTREVAVFDVRDRLVAVAAYDPARRLLRPEKVLGAGG
jgi:tRNA pseudouridine55 synthase